MHRIEHGRLWHGYKTRLAALRQEHKSFNVSVAPVALNSHDGRRLSLTVSLSLFVALVLTRQS